MLKVKEGYITCISDESDWVLFLQMTFLCVFVQLHIPNQYKNTFVCSRTLTSVHDAILEDLAFPAEIVGKRIRIKLDGSRLIKVHLDKNQQTNIEHKVSITPEIEIVLEIWSHVFQTLDWINHIF